MLKLFVIVVTYKGRQWYDRCFSSLRQSLLPVQTVVVDNASNDGSVEYIKENYPEVHVIAQETNVGFGRANNLALRYALENGCDYVFLLNQDAWIESDTLEKLVKIHQIHSDYGILSPMHLDAEKCHIEKGLISYLDDKSITDKALFEDLYFNRTKDVYDTRYVNAAAWLLPRKTLEMVGGFDPVFLHYGEDDNYLNRAMFHKMKVGVCPSCIAVHDTRRKVEADANFVQTSDKIFLSELTNINVPVDLNKMCVYHFGKTISKLVGLKFRQAGFHWYRMRFIMKNKKAIAKSRKRNIEVGPNWIFEQRTKNE